MTQRLIAAAAVLALAACNRGGNEADRQAAGQGQPPANVTVTTPEGRVEVRAGPATGLPEGIPAYPGASTVGGVNVSGGSAQGEGNVIVFTTTDPPAQVIAFYVQAAGAAGYRVAQQMTMGPTAMMAATRGAGDGEGLTVTATGAGGATQVQVVAGHGRR